MRFRSFIFLLLSVGFHQLQAQIGTELSIPLTIQLTSIGNLLLKPAPNAKEYGLLTSNTAAVKQLENRTGLLIYNTENVKEKEHPPLTIGVLPTHKVELRTAQGDISFEDINAPVTSRMASGNVTVKGGKANVSLQLQSGDITVQQSQWQGTLQTRKGNIVLEDSPLLEAHAPLGIVTHRYTEAGLKDKNQLIQSFEKGVIEVTGAISAANLQLWEGKIVLGGKSDNTYLSIRDKGDITIKQAGKRVEAYTKKGTIAVNAPLEFDYMFLTCEGGSVRLDLPAAFKGTVKILSEVIGKEKPDVALSHFWQKEPPVFQPAETDEKGEIRPGYFLYRFEKSIGESTSMLLIQLKNAHLQINPL